MTVTPATVREEDPALTFARYGIVFHFPVQPSTDSAPQVPSGGDKIASFERDILAYAYRDAEVPFVTTVLEPPSGWETLTLEMPAELTFESEGEEFRLRCKGAEGLTRQRTFRLRPSRTDFMAGEVSVLHVGLSPERQTNDETAPESILNEYDVLKLIKLWEGGESLRNPRAEDSSKWLVFRLKSGDELDLAEIAEKLLDGREEVMKRETREGGSGHVVVGTVQLMSSFCDPEEPCSLRNALRDLRREQVPVGGAEKTQQQLRAVGGFVQGLIDFTEIDQEELRDVLVPLDDSPLAAVTVQKGTLLSLAADDRALTVTRDWTAVSPYLLLPHAVLVHDEACLRLAGNSAVSGGSLRALVDRRTLVAQLLDEAFVGNVFHYPSERKLYDSAYASRGLDRLEQRARARLGELEQEIARLTDERRGMAEDLLALLVLILTVVTVKDVVPLEIGLPVAFVLVAAFVVWRRLTFRQSDLGAASLRRGSVRGGDRRPHAAPAAALPPATARSAGVVGSFRRNER
jgi:hypothetical protein